MKNYGVKVLHRFCLPFANLNLQYETLNSSGF